MFESFLTIGISVSAVIMVALLVASPLLAIISIILEIIFNK